MNLDPITQNMSNTSPAAPAVKKFFSAKAQEVNELAKQQFTQETCSIMDEVASKEFEASPQPTRSYFERGMWPLIQAPERCGSRVKKDLF
jgi:hypothetical protein